MIRYQEFSTIFHYYFIPLFWKLFFLVVAMGQEFVPIELGSPKGEWVSDYDTQWHKHNRQYKHKHWNTNTHLSFVNVVCQNVQISVAAMAINITCFLKLFSSSPLPSHPRLFIFVQWTKPHVVLLDHLLCK